MAEHHTLGKVRVFYKSTGFKSGVVVTVDILAPYKIWIRNIELQEIDSGIYEFEFDFLIEGNWLAVFYEDGNKATIQNYDIGQNNSIRRLPSGDGLINL